IAMLRLESRLDFVLQAAIVDRLLRMPTAFFRDFSVGDLADRTLGVEAVRTIVTGRAIRGFLALVSCAFSFAVMFALDIRLGLLAAALAVLRVAMVVAISLVRLSEERESLYLQGWLEGLVLQLLTGVGEWSLAIGELLVAIPRIERIKPIIATATEISDERKSVGEISGAIEFANVSFRYGDSGPLILDDVSLSVGTGEYLAIVGPSG